MILLLAADMNSSRPRTNLIAALALAVALWGCGSTNSFTGTPTANGSTPTGNGNTGAPPPSGSGGGGTGGGGSTPGFSDQLAACGTKNGTTYQITGRVIDATTGQPIAGTVLISLDPVDQGGSINEMKAGTDGKFSSANLVIGLKSFALTFYAVGSSVTYVPKMLFPSSSCPITQGIDIGTVALSPGATANGTVMFTGQTASGTPAQISVELRELYVNFSGMKWGFALEPYLIPFRQDLQAGPSCPANTSCLTNTFPVAATPPLAATYAGTSTQFQPIATSAVWIMSATWNNALNTTTFSNHCTPQFVFSAPQAVTAGGTVNFGALAFTGC
jgi:hypothetical protein